MQPQNTDFDIRNNLDTELFLARSIIEGDRNFPGFDFSGQVLSYKYLDLLASALMEIVRKPEALTKEDDDLISFIYKKLVAFAVYFSKSPGVNNQSNSWRNVTFACNNITQSIQILSSKERKQWLAVKALGVIDEFKTSVPTFKVSYTLEGETSELDLEEELTKLL